MSESNIKQQHTPSIHQFQGEAVVYIPLSELHPFPNQPFKVREDSAMQETVESVRDLAVAVESGSAAKEQADAHNFTYTEVEDQATTLMEVNSGTSDASIIDYLMAKAMIGPGTGYENLTFTVSLNSEQYGVGFRKGSDMAAALNEFFKTSYADGTMQEIAETYNIADKLVAQ